MATEKDVPQNSVENPIEDNIWALEDRFNAHHAGAEGIAGLLMAVDSGKLSPASLDSAAHALYEHICNMNYRFQALLSEHRILQKSIELSPGIIKIQNIFREAREKQTLAQ